MLNASAGNMFGYSFYGQSVHQGVLAAIYTTDKLW